MAGGTALLITTERYLHSTVLIIHIPLSPCPVIYTGNVKLPHIILPDGRMIVVPPQVILESIVPLRKNCFKFKLISSFERLGIKSIML